MTTDIENIRALWIAVVVQAIRDAIGSQADGYARKMSESIASEALHSIEAEYFGDILLAAGYQPEHRYRIIAWILAQRNMPRSRCRRGMSTGRVKEGLHAMLGM